MIVVLRYKKKSYTPEWKTKNMVRALSLLVHQVVKENEMCRDGAGGNICNGAG